MSIRSSSGPTALPVAPTIPRVIVVASTRAICQALELALAATGRVWPEGAFTRGAEAAARAPEAVGIAVMQPGPALGLDAVSQLARRRPPLKAVVLAEDGTPPAVARWLRCGAVKVLPPEASLTDLVHAISCTVAEDGGASSCRARCGPRELTAGVARLTPRELQVAELVERGLSNKEIAERLTIELPTVKNHVHALLEKLDLERRGQVAPALRAVDVEAPLGEVSPRVPVPEDRSNEPLPWPLRAKTVAPQVAPLGRDDVARGQAAEFGRGPPQRSCAPQST